MQNLYLLLNNEFQVFQKHSGGALKNKVMTITRCLFTSVIATQQQSHCVHQNYYSLHHLMRLLLFLMGTNAF